MTWRTRGLVAGAALLALCGAFGAGRYSRPAKVETRDVVHVETRDVVRTQLVHDVQQVHDVATRTVTVTRWEKAAPGAPAVVTQTATTERQAETRRQDHAAAQQDRTSQATATETHTTSAVYARPAWSLTGLVGAQFGAAPRLIPQLPAPVVVGLALEKRIVGPVSAGAWLTSGGAGGLSVRLDW